MDALYRLEMLMSQMHLEPSEDSECLKLKGNKKESVYVIDAIQPNGSRIKLLKTLLSSVCERNCYYCPFRVDRDFRRATFSPDEFARLFMDLYAAKIADGIFLSSGIINGGIYTQDKLISTAEILRHKYKFEGYIHLKIMPGAEKDQVEQAMRVSDRVSINLEAPNTKKLSLLAPHKAFINELLQPLRWIEEIRQTKPRHNAWHGYWPNSVTQFVVGAVGDTDLELLSTTQSLYHQVKLKRAYYSAFSPVPNTPLENNHPTSPVRQRRLYEASFLLRDFGFDVEELEYDATGNLPLNLDPKQAWAQKNLSDPIELNIADVQQLLRIPGIGKKGAQAIIAFRRDNKIRDLSQLRPMGINLNRASPFILLNGVLPSRQLSFAIKN